MRDRIAVVIREAKVGTFAWAATGVLVAALILPFASCTTDATNSEPQLEGAACIKACDAAFDECSIRCENLVDNNMCSQECIAVLDKCKKTCN